MKIKKIYFGLKKEGKEKEKKRKKIINQNYFEIVLIVED